MNLRFAVAITGSLVTFEAHAVEEPFPLAVVIAQSRQDAISAKAVPSGLSREDYLKTRKQIERTEFTTARTTADRVRFKVRYILNNQPIAAVSESYDLTHDRVRVATEAESHFSSREAQFPAIGFDGDTSTSVRVTESSAIVRLNHARQTFSVISPASAALSASGSITSFRNGYFEMVKGQISGNRVVYCLTPSVDN